jgi:hypothetical protein
VHRYSFSGSGTTASDSVGIADGTVDGTTLSGTGAVQCGTDRYVDLPNDVLGGITDITFEAWVRRGTDNSAWQRIFDFGNSDSGTEGTPGNGTSYLFLTTRSSSSAGNAVRLAFRPTGGTFADEVLVTGTAPLPLDAPSHVVGIFDDTGDKMVLYVDGVRIGTTPWTGALSDVELINNWLGRSQFSLDAAFDGTIDEFRIYDEVLDAKQVQYSFEAGSNPSFLE